MKVNYSGRNPSFDGINNRIYKQNKKEFGEVIQIPLTFARYLGDLLNKLCKINFITLRMTLNSRDMARQICWTSQGCKLKVGCQKIFRIGRKFGKNYNVR